jgi:thiol-disulfide isomerase/thioredoxin
MVNVRREPRRQLARVTQGRQNHRRMNALRTLVVTLIFAAVPAFAAGGPKLGQPAPTLHATLLDGTHFDLAAHRGEVVVVHFWATWCAACQVEMPALEAFRAAHAQDGVTIVAISMDDPENRAQVATALVRYGFAGAMAGDAQAAGYGRIWRLPISFVVDRRGLLRADGGAGAEKVYDLAALEREVGPLLRDAK